MKLRSHSEVGLSTTTKSPQAHWEEVFTRQEYGVASWHEPHLQNSLTLISRLALSPDAAVLDVGGGDSSLAHDLLLAGFSHVTVLDLALAALKRAQSRLAEKASQVRWICADITTIQLLPGSIDLWHDRAVYHFLTQEEDRSKYKNQLLRATRVGGHVILATFTTGGPAACSDLPIVKYTAQGIADEFCPEFSLRESRPVLHHTPAGALQPFVYCLLRRQR